VAAPVEGEVLTFLCQKVVELAGVSPADLGAETNIRETIVSSVKILRLVALAERKFDIELDEDSLFDVETLGDLAALIESRLQRMSA
jgi:acyl carrier protein